MEDETYLAIYYDDSNQKIKTSISEIEGWLQNINVNKEHLSKFIYYRLYSRYLKPFQFDCCEYKNYFKNGFSMLANYCLLIEAIQSFKEGLKNSNGKGNKLFGDFSELKNLGNKFYKNVRCGILHQGETLHGWKVTRSETAPLFDSSTKTINATKFGKQMKKVLENYRQKLEESDANTPIWECCKRKLNYVINNCK